VGLIEIPSTPPILRIKPMLMKPRPGLSVHLSQVHKEQLTEVDNALPNRMGLDVEIFGMEGIPEDVLKAHQQRVATQFLLAFPLMDNRPRNPSLRLLRILRSDWLNTGPSVLRRLLEVAAVM
jgi:hypothetical protein